MNGDISKKGRIRDRNMRIAWAGDLDGRWMGGKSHYP